MQQRQLYNARMVASGAATLIALACGSNYVYSAWAPQFAERLKLSATESNLIGLFGNLGMYSMGFPIGYFVDAKGPRPAVLLGVVCLVIGYFPLHQAYDAGSGSVPLLCFFSFLTGFGSCTAFAAAIKTSALNWPHHRGTATAFPLAAFGLSAFFFSLIGSIFFPGDPSAFLMLLSIGTAGMTLVGFFFLKVHPDSTSSYQAVPESDGPPELGEPLHRTSSEEAKRHRSAMEQDEPGTLHGASATDSHPTPAITPHIPPDLESGREAAFGNLPGQPVDETSSLLSSSSALPGENVLGSVVDLDRSRHVDIRGLQLLRSLGFWQLFSIMAILAGIGIMTINNIGNDAKALWQHYDPSKNEDFLIGRQQMHVSTLSVCSFLGRLMSGVGSDFLVKKLHASRAWCLVMASAIFLLAQICALIIENPQLLIFVSGFTGLAYGFLFGVFPSITAESFGIKGLSQNWGWMTMAPSISSNIFNLFYGATLDKNSVVEGGGERVCHKGIDCYKPAYWFTLVACFLGMGVSLWTIQHQRQEKARVAKRAGNED